MAKNKSECLFIAKGTGKKVIKTTGKGLKMIVGLVVAGIALGAGISAFNSASS